MGNMVYQPLCNLVVAYHFESKMFFFSHIKLLCITKVGVVIHYWHATTQQKDCKIFKSMVFIFHKLDFIIFVKNYIYPKILTKEIYLIPKVINSSVWRSYSSRNPQLRRGLSSLCGKGCSVVTPHKYFQVSVDSWNICKMKSRQVELIWGIKHSIIFHLVK